MTVIAISSGHGKYVAGASGYLVEHTEAVRVVNRVADFLKQAGVAVYTFEDVNSHSQQENLNTIVNWHNSTTRDLDVSVHFNANVTTSKPVGTECYYYSQASLANQVSYAIAAASGLINRGGKKNTSLFFLNHTNEPAILIEVCFVDSSADANLYNTHFDQICRAIAETISGQAITEAPPTQPPEPIVPPTETPRVDIKTSGNVQVYVNGKLVTAPPPTALAHFSGRCSWFGGPADQGVSPSEGLAFISQVSQAPYLFLDQQPPGTTGLARRLDPEVYYVACRWDYSKTPKTMLAENRKALLSANGREIEAWPADWGPNEATGRAADLSPGAMHALGLQTDDNVEVIYPAPAGTLVA